MSKSWFYLSIISSLAILTSSCGGEGENKAPAPAPAPAPAANSPAPAAAPTAPTSTAAVPAPTTTNPATTPDTTGIKPVSVDVTAGLIPSTEPENWSRTVAKGRPDPFAVLALQPVEIAIFQGKGSANENTTSQPAPAASITNKSRLINSINTEPNTKITKNFPAIKSGVNKSLPKMKVSVKLSKSSTVLASSKMANSSVNSKATPVQGSIPNYKSPISSIPKSGINRALPKITGIATAKSTSVIAMPNSGSMKKIKIAKVTKATVAKKSNVIETPIKTQIATKPEIVVAKPLQAMAIEISGMIDVAGKTQVIIKLPTESFSRYVEVGERILNGKVLVKRVEGQNSLSPTVVLEEVGVEVARKIGDKSTPVAPEAPPKP